MIAHQSTATASQFPDVVGVYRSGDSYVIIVRSSIPEPTTAAWADWPRYSVPRRPAPAPRGRQWNGFPAYDGALVPLVERTPRQAPPVRPATRRMHFASPRVQARRNRQTP